jgi:hypothetical protein
VEALMLVPLAGNDLPPAVAALVGSATPAKVMAARGMAPLRPAELLAAIYQLSFDADPTVKAAAEAAPASVPDKVLLGPLAEPQPPAVLHFFAERLPLVRRKPLEAILYNHATSDETFVTLARRLDERGLEVIFQNEVRLLRCPDLVAALYFNRNARMSSTSRMLELCARNHLRLEGIPGYDELATALMADANAATPSVSDEEFAAVAAPAEAAAHAEGAPPPDELGPEDVEDDLGGEETEGAKEERSAVIKFDKLKIFEKIRLASVGNLYCRQVLIRDTNKVVAMSVIRSPSITDMEIIAAAGNRAVCDDVIRFIANSRVHMKDYAVKQALVSNPKCPLGTSLRLLTFMHNEDLRTLSRSKNIPGALSTAAKKLMQTRERGGGGGGGGG